MKQQVLAALEAGGTKMVVALGTKDGTILETGRIPTTTPDETLDAVISWFLDPAIQEKYEIVSLGVGAFGPVGVNPASPDYGKILETPKTAWRYADILGRLQEALHVPMALDTDVNVACLGEVTYGASKGLDSVVYLTVGTGVGAGVMVGGTLIHGMLHPEAGHLLLERRADDPLNESHPHESACPYHANCVEGLIAGPAVALRWPHLAGNVGNDEAAMDLLAYYLGCALAAYTLCYSPQRIIIGGGVTDATDLIERSRPYMAQALNGYLVTPELKDLDAYVQHNSLEGTQGILGCFALAIKAQNS